MSDGLYRCRDPRLSATGGIVPPDARVMVVTREPESEMLYQCPGCWSYSLNVKTRDGYECDCGERLTLIDLRARTKDGPHGKNWTEDER